MPGFYQKRKMNFVDKFSANNNNEPSNHTLNSKRGDSFAAQQLQQPPSQPSPKGPLNDSSLIAEVTNDFRRHKRAISVTPEKMMPSSPLPLDQNAPPPARLSMRRHSALESSLREASEYVKKEGLVIGTGAGGGGSGNHQHANGLCSSPSTPGRMRGVPDEQHLFNNNMANFNNTFNQTFNSINNTNIAGSNSNHNNSGGSLRVSSSSISNNNNIRYEKRKEKGREGGRKGKGGRDRERVQLVIITI